MRDANGRFVSKPPANGSLADGETKQPPAPAPVAPPVAPPVARPAAVPSQEAVADPSAATELALIEQAWTKGSAPGANGGYPQKHRHLVSVEHARPVEGVPGAPARRVRHITGKRIDLTISEVRTQYGDPRHLAEARKALADQRKLYGLDGPWREAEPQIEGEVEARLQIE